jgi:hypothetical protein
MRKSFQRQIYRLRPEDMRPHNTVVVRSLGVASDEANGLHERQGRHASDESRHMTGAMLVVDSGYIGCDTYEPSPSISVESTR